MYAGAAKIDITPTSPVWLDGMIRTQRSQGVHDALFARCLVLSNEERLDAGAAIVSVEVCALDEATCAAIRQAAAEVTGIPVSQIVVAATHTHSGPATIGFFNPREDEYTRWLIERVAGAVAAAAAAIRPASVGHGQGREETISHYRRLLADDGHVVMNWEPFEPERLRGPLGVADHQVGVLKVAEADNPDKVIALLFNHGGHPNVMSGDNYLISSDYPGQACRLIEQQFGGVALFANGAQGSVDIDGLRDRDWEGVERLGAALAQAVAQTALGIRPSAQQCMCAQHTAYSVPARKITAREWAWASNVLQRTGGAVAALADGVGDDYVALLYKQLRAVENQDLALEQTCLAIGDCAFVSFPGELYSEIGALIKSRSPFGHTYVIGLANGYIGYVPTAKAIEEGGYAEETRRIDAATGEIVARHSLSLLQSVIQAASLKEENVI